MQVSPSVRAVQVPDDNPLHAKFTTIYLVGRGQVLTIDSGEDHEKYRWMLKGFLAATERAEIGQSLITHYHYDHSSNLKWLRSEFASEIYITDESKGLLGERLPESGLQQLDIGDEVGPSDDTMVRVVPTPGHSVDSVCFYLESEGVLFTGDTVLGEGTTSVNDLSAYLLSLARVRNLPNLRMICPGHGPPIDDPVARIDLYIRHRSQRERQVLKALTGSGAQTSWQVMEKIYPGIAPRLRRSADANVRAHLDKLKKDGRVRGYDGKRRVLSEDEKASAAAEEQVRLEVLRQAESYRDDTRRQAIERQENPPTDEWVEFPRYELL